MGFHVFKVDDGPVIRNKSSSEWYQSVLHPKTLKFRLVKLKQHALLLRHFGSIHESRGVLFRSSRNLRLDLVHTYREGDAWQVDLGCLGGAGAHDQIKKSQNARWKKPHGCDCGASLRACNGSEANSGRTLALLWPASCPRDMKKFGGCLRLKFKSPSVAQQHSHPPETTFN